MCAVCAVCVANGLVFLLWRVDAAKSAAINCNQPSISAATAHPKYERAKKPLALKLLSKIQTMKMERERTHTHAHECRSSKMGNPIENFIANFSIYYIVVIKIYLNLKVFFSTLNPATVVSECVQEEQRERMLIHLNMRSDVALFYFFHSFIRSFFSFLFSFHCVHTAHTHTHHDVLLIVCSFAFRRVSHFFPFLLIS